MSTPSPEKSRAMSSSSSSSSAGGGFVESSPLSQPSFLDKPTPEARVTIRTPKSASGGKSVGGGKSAGGDRIEFENSAHIREVSPVAVSSSVNKKIPDLYVPEPIPPITLLQSIQSNWFEILFMLVFIVLVLMLDADIVGLFVFPVILYNVLA